MDAKGQLRHLLNKQSDEVAAGKWRYLLVDFMEAARVPSANEERVQTLILNSMQVRAAIRESRNRKLIQAAAWFGGVVLFATLGFLLSAKNIQGYHFASFVLALCWLGVFISLFRAVLEAFRLRRYSTHILEEAYRCRF
jgi:hypothetical protein